MFSQCNKAIPQVSKIFQSFSHSFNVKRTQTRTHSGIERTVDRTLIIARRKVSSCGRYIVVAWCCCCCMLPTNYYTLNAPQAVYQLITIRLWGTLVCLKRSAYGYAHLALHNWCKQLNGSSFEVVWLLLFGLNIKSNSSNYSMEMIPPTQFHSITNCRIIPPLDTPDWRVF